MDQKFPRCCMRISYIAIPQYHMDKGGCNFVSEGFSAMAILEGNPMLTHRLVKRHPLQANLLTIVPCIHATALGFT